MLVDSPELNSGLKECSYEVEEWKSEKTFQL